jgi:hypothetical protein
MVEDLIFLFGLRLLQCHAVREARTTSTSYPNAKRFRALLLGHELP